MHYHFYRVRSTLYIFPASGTKKLTAASVLFNGEFVTRELVFSCNFLKDSLQFIYARCGADALI